MVKLIWMSIVPAPQAGAKGKEVATIVAEQDLGNHWWFWAQWQGTNTAEGTDEFQTEAGKFSCGQQDAKTIPGDKSNAFLPEQNGSGMKEHVTTAIGFTNTASNSRTSGCLCVVLLWAVLKQLWDCMHIPIQTPTLFQAWCFLWISSDNFLRH